MSHMENAIDRELLQDIGFEKGTGWDVEVWVFGGWFWVCFELPRSHWIDDERRILLTDYTRQEFFAKFLGAFRDEVHKNLQGYRD